MYNDNGMKEAMQFRQTSLKWHLMGPTYEDGMANSVDPDQTAPLICVCTVFPDLSVKNIERQTK